MITWELFRPWNVFIIAVIALLWAFAFSSVKAALDAQSSH